MTDTPPQASTSYPTTNLTSLTDAQLRQTITQLSNAATSQFQPFTAAGTQSAPSKGQLVSPRLLGRSSHALSLPQECPHLVDVDDDAEDRDAFPPSRC